MRRYVPGCARRKAAEPARVPPFWTASRSGWRKKGRCWGYDAGKKITGRKRHLLVDTLGLILAIVITAASVQDRDGGRKILEQVPEIHYPELLTIFADAGYRGRLEDIALREHTLELVIVPKLRGQSTFVVLPKRWVVERTFAWLMRYRRLRADYETEPASSRGWILVAAIARRLTR